MMIFDYKKIREYISRCKWCWAQSMIEVPHEYIHRDKCSLTRDEFYYIVSAQRQDGVHERWWKYNFPYLYIDGYKYWTMGDPFETTWILNRQKVFNEFDFLEWPLPRIDTEQEMEIMGKTIIASFEKNIFEAGIGNGDFVRLTKILPEKYYGVDPSKKAIEKFRRETSGFYRRCSTKSFEESINKWLSSDSVVVMTFGTASYIMEQYLKKLSESGLEYCLTFYREGYNPEEFSEMHHFAYSKNSIKSIFPNGNIYNHKNFITISSKQLKWQKPTVENDLFPVR